MTLCVIYGILNILIFKQMKKFKPMIKIKKTFNLIAFFLTITLTFTHCNSNNVKLDKDSFVPDTTYETIFPWDDVKVCFDNQIDANKFHNHKACPKCGRRSENLAWIEFRSPKWTWEKLAGRQGPLSICPHCKIQVEFITEIMN